MSSFVEAYKYYFCSRNGETWRFSEDIGVMGILSIIIGILCPLAGLAGCFLPVIPDPLVAYAGLLLLHFTDKVQYSITRLLLWLLLVIVLQVLDYFIPILSSKYSGGTHWGARGCLAGTIIRLFFIPWDIVLGLFLGAFIGELLDGKEVRQALKSGMGSLFGFLFGAMLKCILRRYSAWEFVSALVQQ